MGIEDIAWNRSIRRCHVNLHRPNHLSDTALERTSERGGRSSWRLSGTATTTPIVGVLRRRPLLVPPRSHDSYPVAPVTNRTRLPSGVADPAPGRPSFMAGRTA
jgi:hypothetical protein